MASTMPSALTAIRASTTCPRRLGRYTDRTFDSRVTTDAIRSPRSEPSSTPVGDPTGRSASSVPAALSIASRNAGAGFDVDNIVGGTFVRCEASGNGGTGFQLGTNTNRCTVERCVSTQNLGGGFSVLGTGNLVIGNRATASAVGGYNFAANNFAAPIISGGEVMTNGDRSNANIEY